MSSVEGEKPADAETKTLLLHLDFPFQKLKKNNFLMSAFCCYSGGKHHGIGKTLSVHFFCGVLLLFSHVAYV